MTRRARARRRWRRRDAPPPRRRRRDVAFGRKVAKPPKHPGSKATGRKGLATEVRPFNLSVGNKPKPTANAAPAKKRDPGRVGGPERDLSVRGRPVRAARDALEVREEKKRTLEDVFADAARAKEAEALRERERIRSKEAVRQSLIVSTAAKVAAPAIAAAEAAQRETRPRRRRRRRKPRRRRRRRSGFCSRRRSGCGNAARELLGAGPSGEGEGECEEGTSRETFASSEGGGEEDDAPLMASTSDLPGLIARSGAFYTLVPIRPRSRGERRSLRTFARRISPPTPRFQSPSSTPFNSN